MEPVKALVWNEHIHERKDERVGKVYPDGIHACIAEGLEQEGGIEARTATLGEPEHGLTEESLSWADVILWWGHMAHGDVGDEAVERVVERVWSGMGAVFLHSAHFSKPFKRLMGSPCNLSWREVGERERLWVTSPRHEIAAGLPPSFELGHEEMYGEPFGVPEPAETVFVSWFEGGEVFRSGLTYRRGAGKVFYFRPGHETYPTYRDANVRRVLANAVRWARSAQPAIEEPSAAPNVPWEQAPESTGPEGGFGK